MITEQALRNVSDMWVVSYLGPSACVDLLISLIFTVLLRDTFYLLCLFHKEEKN